MAPRTLIIKKLVRTPQFDPEDELQFSPGVNIIVGKPNTGKTKWLNMLDHLMGDPGKPEEAFGLDLIEKYDSVSALMSVNGEDFWVERRWKERGSKTKIFIEDAPFSTDDFQHFIMERLKFPILHFPKGNPYAERKWPELSWRTLLRHIYRQQRFWSNIADMQTDAEQHACLMQFLGIAEHLFSDKSGQLVEKRREQWKLEGAKEQFYKILDKIYHEITDEKQIHVALTADSIDMVMSRLSSKISELRQKREQLLLSLQNTTISQTEIVRENSDDFDKLSVQWVNLQTEKDEHQRLLGKAEKRLEELSLYKHSIECELTRMSRAKSAGQILVELKVTHCPVCDQPVSSSPDDKHCYLCGKTWRNANDEENGKERVEAEIKRLKEENKEILDLVAQLSEEREQRRRVIRSISEEIHLIESRLQPIRKVAASILPPEIGMIDMELGRLHENRRQMERIKSALEYQKLLNSEINQAKAQIEELEAAVAIQSSKIQFAIMGDTLAEHMMTYLNELKANGNELWSLGRINVNIKERSFDFRIEGEKWSTKVGGTLALYFFLSYHYGLMRLTSDENCHYPGLVIIDLPATLVDGSKIEDKENFIIEPFIKLLNRPSMENTQAIILGSAFEGLEGVNRHRLNKIWK